MAYVEAVCLSHKKGIVKKEQNHVVALENWGIDGDAHAGDWHRQVSLLAGESIDNVKEVLPTLKNGAFAENIITRGLDLSGLKVGDRLAVGNTIILEVTQIGKECHNKCAIYYQAGDCIMPREGVFAKVLEEGKIHRGDEIQIL